MFTARIPPVTVIAWGCSRCHCHSKGLQPLSLSLHGVAAPVIALHGLGSSWSTFGVLCPGRCLGYAISCNAVRHVCLSKMVSWFRSSCNAVTHMCACIGTGMRNHVCARVRCTPVQAHLRGYGCGLGLQRLRRAGRCIAHWFCRSRLFYIYQQHTQDS